MNRRTFLAGGLALAGCKPKGAVKKGEEWAAAQAGPKQDDGHARELLAEAERRIPKLRGGTYTVRMMDAASDTPLHAGVKIDARQIVSDFVWGYSGTKTHGVAGAQHVAYREMFNHGVCKCYWDERWHQPIEHEQGKRVYERFKAEMDFCAQLGWNVKGHPLVWTVPKALPPWVQALPLAGRKAALRSHVEQLVRFGSTGVQMWDLANEMLWEPTLAHTEARKWPHLESVAAIAAELAPIFHLAREANPVAKYGLNDYGLERTYRPEVSAKMQRERYVALAKALADAGAAPDMLGTQAHVGEPYTATEFVTMLDKLATAGLPVHITEFWVNSRREDGVPDERDAQALHQALTLAFGHPAVQAFCLWHTDNDVFLDGSNELSTLGRTWQALVAKAWRTPDQTLITNDDGEITLRGMDGNYNLLALTGAHKDKAVVKPVRNTVPGVVYGYL